ncbi:MAG: cytidine deaminase [Saprospiraceae bacterium]|nr:cytidine deaminase [Saprospiraceae bacterium]MBK6784228.1 cytidine deaminase [Saprospiraceae bacterium]MBK7525354.1 cytidine deaminase [Saprospiraceae bacterium]MBK8852951.1 cytidine deaminase [Saprospiraceae bacterium]MBP6695472.1 cytidine deaminase [Saprospiraceae bacterium]
MEIKKIESSYIIHHGLESLPQVDQNLIAYAITQLDHAYAPYSQFKVGAAVRLKDGSTYAGCNQENASYPLCMCGERVALYNAAVYSPNVAPETLAIVIKNEKKAITTPVSPCGACRQVIAEFEQRFKNPIRILLTSDSKTIYELNSVQDILPLSFDSSFL